MRRWRDIVLRLGGAFVGLALITLLLAPRLTTYTPANQIDSAVQPIIVTFNRPVALQSAIGHFAISPPVNGRFTVNHKQLLFTPESALTYGQSYTVTVEAGLRGRNGLPLLRGATWSFTVGSPQLLFLRQAEGHTALWVTSLTGDGSARRLTDTKVNVWDYAVTADGRQVLFTSLPQTGGSTLYRLDLVNGGLRPLLDCPDNACQAPQPQPRGSLVAYEKALGNDGSRLLQVWLVDSETGATWPGHSAATLAFAGIETLTSRYPRWSADGRYLSYFKPDASLIVILDMEGGEPILVPASVNEMGYWSPVDYRLLYTELTQNETDVDDESQPAEPEDELLPEPGLYAHLSMVDLNDGRTVNLSEGLYVNDGRSAWHPDGRSIAFSRIYDAGRQIWLYETEQGRSWPLTADPLYDHTALAWSPDGRYLAFMHVPLLTMAGQPTIQLYDREQGTLTEITTAAFVPGWLP
jgi:Tol biopolymer transport system component